MKHILLFFLFSLGSVTVLSQIKELESIKRDYKALIIPSANKVLIYNFSENKLFFQLAYPGAQFYNYEIPASTYLTFDLKDYDRLIIRVTTQNQTVEYILLGGYRYKIEWDSARNLWNVFKYT